MEALKNMPPKAKLTVGGLIAAVLGAYVQNTVWTGDVAQSMAHNGEQVTQEIKLLRMELMHEVRSVSSNINAIGSQVNDHEQRLRALERHIKEDK